MEQEYLSEAEAAEYFRCSPHTLRFWRYMKKHGLTAQRAGNKVIYRKSELDRFMAASTAAHEAKRSEAA